MKKTSPVNETESSLPLSKLLKLLQLIGILKVSRWTIKQLVERLDSSKSSLYRYLKLLEEAGFLVETDFHKRYFIVTTEDDPMQAQFTMEELALVRSLIQSGAAGHALCSSLLKKLSLNSELDKVPRMFLKAHLGMFVEQLATAMRNKHQVCLKKYHSASSDTVRHRVVEPIHFGDNYQTITALDVEDQKCKQFKLDRIGEVKELHSEYQHEPLHTPSVTDIFGFAGVSNTWIKLRLSTRAYVLLREEHPLAIPYTEREKNYYVFHAPVVDFGGIGRFVTGLSSDVSIIKPESFKKYVEEKLVEGLQKLRGKGGVVLD